MLHPVPVTAMNQARAGRSAPGRAGDRELPDPLPDI